MGGREIYDACAMGAWLRPELLTATPCHLDVDDEGRTLITGVQTHTVNCARLGIRQLVLDNSCHRLAKLQSRPQSRRFPCRTRRVA